MKHFKNKLIETMTTQEILEGNKIIAEFMGGVFHPTLTTILDIPVKSPITGNLVTHIDKLRYHLSWDWLMPVVEKIESLPTDKENGDEFQFSITGDGIAITQYDDGSGVIASSVNYIGKSKLESTFEVVVEFIKWHTNEVKEVEK